MLVICVKDLVVEAKHGIYEHEKTKAQPFKFNVELTLEDERASLSDDLADSLDYVSLRDTITKVAQANSFNLLERLARQVADELLQDQRVTKVVVAIDKPTVFKDSVPGVRLEVTRETAG